MLPFLLQKITQDLSFSQQKYIGKMIQYLLGKVVKLNFSGLTTFLPEKFFRNEWLERKSQQMIYSRFFEEQIRNLNFALNCLNQKLEEYHSEINEKIHKLFEEFTPMTFDHYKKTLEEINCIFQQISRMEITKKQSPEYNIMEIQDATNFSMKVELQKYVEDFDHNEFRELEELDYDESGNLVYNKKKASPKKDGPE